ncbi:membrane protein [Flagellimonas marinaquae]|uniref:Membrane protein n=1 Tax=Flagellimonas marinaquae TaxID=254955 RepID=A0AA48KN13_9FLAO|nr:membrane protein [Allomuricauda aquimarina]
MASGFFAVLDDISALMDDVASMSKIATKKTAGILGDDLAVNAEKATGFLSSREIPVLWAITKGSFVNKLIILPIAFLLSAYLPTAITVILVLGGVYLAYEGAEKVYEFIFHRKDNADGDDPIEIPEEDLPELEKKKIKQAIVTDFILSIEIVIIALSTVVNETLTIQIATVSVVALLATVGVYGIVALIVRMDDYGYRLINLNEETDSFSDKVGMVLVNALPKIIKALSVVGTLALLLVSGGIFSHNVEFFHHLFPGLPSLVKDFILGLGIGFVAVLLLQLINKLFKRKS